MKMMSGKELGGMVSHILLVHSLCPVRPDQAFEVDGVTPFGARLVLGATMILQEGSLSPEVRVRGVKALLSHHIPQRTTAELPGWVTTDSKVEKLVDELNFAEEENKFALILERSEEAILVSFFENVIGLLYCEGKIEQIAELKHAVRKQLDYIEGRYPQLKIIKVARGLMQ